MRFWSHLRKWGFFGFHWYCASSSCKKTSRSQRSRWVSFWTTFLIYILSFVTEHNKTHFFHIFETLPAPSPPLTFPFISIVACFDFSIFFYFLLLMRNKMLKADFHFVFYRLLFWMRLSFGKNARSGWLSFFSFRFLSWLQLSGG